MDWWIGLFFGVIVAPPALNWTRLKIAFEEGGLAAGFGAWFGVAIMTTAIVFLGLWLGKTFL